MPACKSEKANALLTVEAENARVGKLELATCKSCGTAFFLGDDPVIGYDHEGFAQDYWYNYVQSGAGIDAMLHPVLALGDRAKGSLLDVGCGFGFVPHFWTEMVSARLSVSSLVSMAARDVNCLALKSIIHTLTSVRRFEVAGLTSFSARKSSSMFAIPLHSSRKSARG